MKKASVKVCTTEMCKVSEEFFTALNNRDLEEIADFFTEEASLTFPGNSALGGFYLGRKKVRRFFEKLFIFVPDISFQIINIVSADRQADVEWISTGISKKNIPYENSGISIIVGDKGRIKEMRHYLDTEKLKNP